MKILSPRPSRQFLKLLQVVKCFTFTQMSIKLFTREFTILRFYDFEEWKIGQINNINNTRQFPNSIIIQCEHIKTT